MEKDLEQRIKKLEEDQVSNMRVFEEQVELSKQTTKLLDKVTYGLIDGLSKVKDVELASSNLFGKILDLIKKVIFVMFVLFAYILILINWEGITLLSQKMWGLFRALSEGWQIGIIFGGIIPLLLVLLGFYLGRKFPKK